MLLRRRSRVRQILHQRRRNRVVFRRVRPRLLLASNSPRRRELLLEAGFDFEIFVPRSEEHTSELQSRSDLVCRLLLEKKKKTTSMRECDCTQAQFERL